MTLDHRKSINIVALHPYCAYPIKKENAQCIYKNLFELMLYTTPGQYLLWSLP